MGITLHAIVERLVPADDYSKTDRWVEVGKWGDFGKHFALKEWLYENAQRGWPKDSRADNYAENEVLDVWRGWTTVGRVEDALLAIRTEARKEPLVFVECLSSLVAALRVDACEHPYTGDEDTWCNVCGAYRFEREPRPWVKPHWRDRLILGWRTERLDDATIAALTKPKPRPT